MAKPLSPCYYGICTRWLENGKEKSEANGPSKMAGKRPGGAIAVMTQKAVAS